MGYALNHHMELLFFVWYVDHTIMLQLFAIFLLSQRFAFSLCLEFFSNLQLVFLYSVFCILYSVFSDFEFPECVHLQVAARTRITLGM